MAGREKKLPAMPGTTRKSLVSPGRSADPPSRRASLLQLPSPRSTVTQLKRFTSPYTMRSESPVRTLRNGKQQRMQNTSMLDGIPIVKKRTRSVISDCDTQSLFNVSFNDTSSLAGDFNPPDSPMSLFSLQFTPRRRSRNQNSECCSVMSMPVTTPKQKRIDILAQIAMPSPSRKQLINKTTVNKPGKAPKKQVSEGKQPLLGKRKLTKVKGETEAVPVKKVRKNAKKSESKESQNDSESPKNSKNATPNARTKKVIKNVVNTKGKNTVNNKTNKNNVMVKKRQKLLVSQSLLTNGKVRGKTPKMTSQILARKISKTTKGKLRGNKGVPTLLKKRTKEPVKTEEMTSVQRRKLQSILLDDTDINTLKLKKKQEAAAELEKKQLTTEDKTSIETKVEEAGGTSEVVIKPEEAESSSAVEKNKEAEEATTTKMAGSAGKGVKRIVKRKFVRKMKVVPQPTETEASDVTIDSEVVAPSTVKQPAKKGKKPTEDAKFEPSDSPLDGETLNTLTQVSKILKKIAETPPESAVENNFEETPRSEARTPRSEIRTPKNLEIDDKATEDAESENKTPPDAENENKTPKDIENETKTPPPSSPKITNTLQPTEMNGVEPQKDGSHVSPINSLASKLRRKLSQSPGITSPMEARAVAGKVPVVLPIINSLSAAAKQTSSFLNCNDNSGPVTRRETQWKVNKKLIYNKIKTNKQNGGKLNNSLKGKVTNLLNKKSQISSRHVQVIGPLAMQQVPKEGSVLGIVPEQTKADKISGTDMDSSSEVTDEAMLPTEHAEAKDKPAEDDTVGLDSNENKLENKTDQSIINDSSESIDAVIPDKDKTDEHSSLDTNKSTSPPPPLTPTVIENNLDTEKTDKELSVEINLNVEKARTESSDSNSEISNLTPNSESPLENKEIEEEDEEMPPLHLDDSIVTSSPLCTPSKAVMEENVSIPEAVKEPEPPKRPTIFFEGEDLVAKASVLGALGLQSNQALSEQAKAPKVPKLRLVCRPTHKKHRRSTNSDPSAPNYKEKTYTVCREGDSLGDWDPSPVKIVRDPALDPCSRSLLWYPRMPISNGKALETLVEVSVPEQPGVGVGDGQNGDNIDGGEKSSEPLIIPEKSSSFAIHPGRLCEDVCCYCHNKFGLYDTPLHVAQLKGEEKQQTVLAREPLLTLESCLCDACFRHLDRPGPPRCPKPPPVKTKAQPNEICCFVGCNQAAVHPLMRKWKRRVRTMLRREPQDGKSWTCEKHYSELARVSVCGMCLRRSASTQMYRLEESAAPRLNQLLLADSIPVQLNGDSYLCKKCRYYASLRLRCEDYTQLNSGNRLFLKDHRSRVLKVLNVDPTSVEELFNEREKPKKQTKRKSVAAPETPEVTPTPPSAPTTPATPATPASTSSSKPSKQIRIKLATPTQKSANASPASRLNANRPSLATPKASSSAVRPSPSQGKDKNDLRRTATQNASTSTGKIINKVVNNSPASRVTVNVNSASRTKPVSILPRPSPQTSSLVNNDQSDPYSFVVSPPPPPIPPPSQEFPSASDVGMNSSFEFQPIEPNSMWQKVNATFQFDKKTRTLWHQLHAPYGSYTSFLRHLVLLETHWRNGDLALTPTATPRARQYLGSVRNRIEAYEGVPNAPETPNVPLILDVRSLATENSGGWNV